MNTHSAPVLAASSITSAPSGAQARSRPVAVVTGGLQGLGRGITVQLARDGFDVAVLDLADAASVPPESLAVPEAPEARIHYQRLDIADLAAHEAALAAVQATLGPLSCLVNNAGIAARPLTDLLALSPQAFDRSVDINLRGTFFLSQAFARHLIAHPAAAGSYRSLVFITSIAAEMASPDRAQYCTTKAALSMVSRLFALRLAAEQIHVHEVRPGFMRTAMTASAGTEVIDRWMEEGRVPQRRWGTPEDVGLAVSTLAQGRLPYMTGQPLWVAGGLNIAQAT